MEGKNKQHNKHLGIRKKIVDMIYPQMTQKKGTFLIHNASILAGKGEGVTNICEVFQQADGLTSSEGALNRGGFRIIQLGGFSLEKPGASYKKSLILTTN